MFKLAKPIFLKNLSDEMNILAQFKTSINFQGEKINLKVAGATFFRISINGEFIHYGAARAAHGYQRIDNLDITNKLSQGKNEICIEVISYNVNSFYVIKHSGFVIAEILADNDVIAYTGRDFIGFRNLTKIHKVMRYSYQRHLGEVYDLSCNPLEPCDIETLDINPHYIPRHVPLPTFGVIPAEKIVSRGNFSIDETIIPLKVRFVDEISDDILGFPLDEILHRPYHDYQKMKFTSTETIKSGFKPTALQSNQYALFDMTRVCTGFIKAKIKVLKSAKIYISFEEYTESCYIDLSRLVGQVTNVVEYNLPVGEYDLETIEPYSFRYLQVMAMSGEVLITELAIREYAFPKFAISLPKTDNPKLLEIFNAAVETFRQNTLDVYMDCPSRERAGWLCDSYYTAQAEFAFTNRCVVERAFMENFVMGGDLPDISKGMLGMVYPGDTLRFIPQWSLWYILELPQYLDRDRSADKNYYKDLCYNLLSFFKGYINDDGLLEKLPGWNFVEWSKANDWVMDVNYPTNMLFAKALEIIGNLYDDTALINQANGIRKTVVNQSFNGTVFTDNAVRNENLELVNAGNISEACQYYAIMFDTIDINDPKYSKLKEIVYNVFSADRSKYSSTGFDIEPANSLMGIYLRMELLLREKSYTQLLDEIIEFFGNMAQLTGTLWEHNKVNGSLNHGFASFAGVAIQRACDALSKTHSTENSK